MHPHEQTHTFFVHRFQGTYRLLITRPTSSHIAKIQDSELYEKGFYFVLIYLRPHSNESLIGIDLHCPLHQSIAMVCYHLALSFFYKKRRVCVPQRQFSWLVPCYALDTFHWEIKSLPLHTLICSYIIYIKKILGLNFYNMFCIDFISLELDQKCKCYHRLMI